MAEPMMNAAVHFDAEWLAASKHIKDCFTESAETATSDYKLFFDRLQTISSPQNTMTIFFEHWQSRFLHNVKCWNDMRTAMTASQHTLMQRLQVEAPQAANQKATSPANRPYAGNFFMDSMTSAFNSMAEMTQDSLVSEFERAIDEDAPYKASSSKSTKSHHASSKT